MEPEDDQEEETLEELLRRQKRENMRQVLDFVGPGTKPEVTVNLAAKKVQRTPKRNTQRR